MSLYINKIYHISVNYDKNNEVSSIYVSYGEDGSSISGYGEGLVTLDGNHKRFEDDESISKFILEEFQNCPQDFKEYALRFRKKEFYKDVLE